MTTELKIKTTLTAMQNIFEDRSIITIKNFKVSGNFSEEEMEKKFYNEEKIYFDIIIKHGKNTDPKKELQKLKFKYEN